MQFHTHIPTVKICSYTILVQQIFHRGLREHEEAKHKGTRYHCNKCNTQFMSTTNFKHHGRHSKRKCHTPAFNAVHDSHINASENNTKWQSTMASDIKYTNAGYNQRFKLHKETEHVGSTYP